MSNALPADHAKAHPAPLDACAGIGCQGVPARVREALWALYGPQMQQAWVEQLQPTTPAPDFDPDAPF